MKNKKQIIFSICNMLTLIDDCPELFSDGIDEDIKELLYDVLKYIEGGAKK